MSHKKESKKKQHKNAFLRGAEQGFVQASFGRKGQVSQNMLGLIQGHKYKHGLSGLAGGSTAVSGAISKDTGVDTLKDTFYGSLAGGAIGGLEKGILQNGTKKAVPNTVAGAAQGLLSSGINYNLGSLVNKKNN